MKKAIWNHGIPPLLFAAALAAAGCLNPIAPPPSAAKAAEAAEAASGSRQYEPYTVNVSLNEDGDEPPDGRSVAGPTRERIIGLSIRNYIQVIAVDKADGTIAGFHEVRRIGLSQSAVSLTLNGLVSGHTYGILLLQGHWERDYAAETGDDNYAYTANPPTLLSAGYQDVTFSGGGTATITVWPIYVDTVFTAGSLSAEPAVNAEKPEAVSLAASPWNVNWKVLRGASGTFSGLGDLIQTQKAAGFESESLLVTGKKAAVWTGADAPDEDAPDEDANAPDALDSLTFTGHTVTLPLADYTDLSQIGKGGAVNFALHFAPFNLTEGWAAYDGASVFDLAAGPPEWVIRNGLNDMPQDDKTDFAYFGNVPVEMANGNGAVRFAVADPQQAAAGELTAAAGFYKNSSVTFTASGFTGTARALYAAAASGGAPGYTAYIPLGDVEPGSHTMPLTLPGTDGGWYDVWLILIKDGKAGAPHKIIFDREDPFPSVANARAYLEHLTVSGNPLGGSAGNPALLPMKVNLANGADSLANLLAMIGTAGKYVNLDLSLCAMAGTEFDPAPANSAGKDRVVSLALPDTAKSIKGGSGADPAFKHFTSLAKIGGRGITAIGRSAFSNCSVLTAADFPAAADIGGSAFGHCPVLTSVNLPAAVNIGEWAFGDCTSLTALNLPAAVSIGSVAFQNCTSLTELNLPKATAIGRVAFQNCTSLTSLKLPAATSIGDSAFFETGAKPLYLTLPASAPALGAGSAPSGGYAKAVTLNRTAASATYDELWQAAFKKLFGGSANITLNGNPPLPVLFSSVTEVRAYLAVLAPSIGSSPGNPVSLPMKMNLGSAADSLANLLSLLIAAGKYANIDLSRCSMDGTEFNPGPSSSGKNWVVFLTLPDTAQSIPGDSGPGPAENPAFKNFSSLKTISGRGITSVGKAAFMDCTTLSAVNFPEAASIGGYAFEGCEALTQANFPKATALGQNALEGCAALTGVNLPAVTGIGNYAFEGCSALTSLNLPAVENIGEYAFRNCSALTTLNLPAAKNIGEYAFRNCTALTTANLPAAASIGSLAFMETGAKPLYLTLPANAPALGAGSVLSSVYAKTVTLNRPATDSPTYDEPWQAVFKRLFGGNANITLKGD
jgi:hypothetical protein